MNDVFMDGKPDTSKNIKENIKKSPTSKSPVK